MTDLDRIRARLEAIRGRADILAISDQPLHLLVSQDVPWLVACLGVALVTLDEIAKGADGGELWEGSQDAAISALADIYDLSEGQGEGENNGH